MRRGSTHTITVVRVPKKYATHSTGQQYRIAASLTRRRRNRDAISIAPNGPSTNSAARGTRGPTSATSGTITSAPIPGTVEKSARPGIAASIAPIPAAPA